MPLVVQAIFSRLGLLWFSDVKISPVAKFNEECESEDISGELEQNSRKSSKTSNFKFSTFSKLLAV